MKAVYESQQNENTWQEESWQVSSTLYHLFCNNAHEMYEQVSVQILCTSAVLIYSQDTTNDGISYQASGQPKKGETKLARRKYTQ